MYQEIKSLCASLASQFDSIPEKRKEILEKISRYIQKKKMKINLFLWFISARTTQGEVFLVKSWRKQQHLFTVLIIAPPTLVEWKLLVVIQIP